MRLREAFPTIATLEEASISDVAAIVLAAAQGIGRSFDISSLFQPAGDYKTDDTVAASPHDRMIRAYAVIGEAIGYLLSQNFIALAGDDVTRVSYRVTRLGHGMKTRQNFDSYAKNSLLSPELLHPSLATARSMFLAGTYDAAVLESFIQVEIAVRALGPYDAGDIGKDLMFLAFGENGPLKDTFAVTSERQAFAFLFAGAIGYLKNPHSHRKVGIDDARSSALRILLASELLQLVEQHEASAILIKAKGPTIP